MAVGAVVGAAVNRRMQRAAVKSFGCKSNQPASGREHTARRTDMRAVHLLSQFRGLFFRGLSVVKRLVAVQRLQ